MHTKNTDFWPLPLAGPSAAADRARAADVLLDNEGTREELEAEVEVLWHDLAARAAGDR